MYPNSIGAYLFSSHQVSVELERDVMASLASIGSDLHSPPCAWPPMTNWCFFSWCQWITYPLPPPSWAICPFGCHAHWWTQACTYTSMQGLSHISLTLFTKQEGVWIGSFLAAWRNRLVRDPRPPSFCFLQLPVHVNVAIITFILIHFSFIGLILYNIFSFRPLPSLCIISKDQKDMTLPIF